MTLSSVNTNLTEGQLLLGALAILTTQNFTDKTPDEVLDIVKDAASKMSFPDHYPTKQPVAIPHTPEPWIIDPKNPLRVTSAPVDEDVCECLSESDAARILACVNSCKNVPNEWLEENSVQARIVEISELKRERDDLKARWEIVKHLELDAYEKAKAQLDTCQAMLREVVEFSDKSRGRFCIPESLVNRIKENL